MFSGQNGRKSLQEAGDLSCFEGKKDPFESDCVIEKF